MAFSFDPFAFSLLAFLYIVLQEQTFKYRVPRETPKVPAGYVCHPSCSQISAFRFPNREQELCHRCTTTIRSHVSTTGIILTLVNIFLGRNCRCLPIGTAKSSPSTITVPLTWFLRLFYRRARSSFRFHFLFVNFYFLISWHNLYYPRRIFCIDAII